MKHEPFTGFLQGNVPAQKQKPQTDPVNPDHYRGLSNGAEVIDITENLTFNGGNAIKYLARACRLDGNNKGQIVEDLKKSLWYTRRELSRIQEGEHGDEQPLEG